MKKFNVNVNGTVYSVEVEEVGGTVAAAPVAPAAPAAAPAAAPVALRLKLRCLARFCPSTSKLATKLKLAMSS